LPAENNTAALRDWLRTCPAILNINRFGVDFAGRDPTEYTIYSVPTALKYKTDILGDVYYDSIQELNYIFACVFPFSMDVLQALENLGFFSEVMEWIYQQNVKKNFPEIAEGPAISIMPTLTPFVFNSTANTGRYQIQLKIKYRRNA